MPGAVGNLPPETILAALVRVRIRVRVRVRIQVRVRDRVKA